MRCTRKLLGIVSVLVAIVLMSSDGFAGRIVTRQRTVVRGGSCSAPEAPSCAAPAAACSAPTRRQRTVVRTRAVRSRGACNCGNANCTCNG